MVRQQGATTVTVTESEVVLPPLSVTEAVMRCATPPQPPVRGTVSAAPVPSGPS